MWTNYSDQEGFQNKVSEAGSLQLGGGVVFTVLKGLPVYCVSSPVEESIFVGVRISVMNSDLSGPWQSSIISQIITVVSEAQVYHANSFLRMPIGLRKLIS